MTWEYAESCSARALVAAKAGILAIRSSLLRAEPNRGVLVLAAEDVSGGDVDPGANGRAQLGLGTQDYFSATTRPSSSTLHVIVAWRTSNTPLLE